MTAPGSGEWVCVIDVRHVPGTDWDVIADEACRRRLAARFGLTAIERLHALVSFDTDKDSIAVKGRISAAIVQACAISGEDFPVMIDEPVDLRFVPERDGTPDEEIEITADQCDEIAYTGLAFDLGEALAQTLALAFDPFAQGPDADRARADHGLAGDGPAGAFAALAALKLDR